MTVEAALAALRPIDVPVDGLVADGSSVRRLTLEAAVDDRLSFRRFAGIPLAESVLQLQALCAAINLRRALALGLA